MAALDKIMRGKRPLPPRLWLYGIDGIGKTTWASKAPKPVFITTEDGQSEIDCASFPKSNSYSEFMENLSAIENEQHDFETVVIDSLDWLERLIWMRVCEDDGSKSIEEARKGYGKGYVAALTEYWVKVIAVLDRLRAKGMTIILLSHHKVEQINDPETQSYSQYQPRLQKLANAYIREWVDATLFATRKIRVTKDELDESRGIAKTIGQEGSDRIIKTTGGPSVIAKNRYSLPAELPLSWQAVADGIIKSQTGG